MKEIPVRTDDGHEVVVEYDLSELATALGFEGAKAAELNARLCLVTDMCAIIKKKKLTQVQVARLLGIHQSRVSTVLRGAARGITIDALVQYAARLGLAVRVTTQPIEKPGTRAIATARRTTRLSRPKKKTRKEVICS